LARQLSDGIRETVGDETTAELAAKRDALIVAMQTAIQHLRRT
jgi:hypothetical protein